MTRRHVVNFVVRRVVAIAHIGSLTYLATGCGSTSAVDNDAGRAASGSGSSGSASNGSNNAPSSGTAGTASGSANNPCN